MHAQPDSLWRRAPAWRWLMAAAVISSVLLYSSRPGRQGGAYTPPLAQFDASKVASGTTAPLNTSNPAGMAAPAGNRKDPQSSSHADELDTSASFLATPDPAAVAAPVEITPSAYLPPVRSRVVWSNLSGAVSGGGLVAEYCCAGPSSAVLANASVKTGMHYWELTFSASPGKEHPSTWTNAGITTAKPGSDQVRRIMPANLRGSTSAIATSFSVINWGKSGDIRNGDVFMFAFDADQNLFYYGLNGIWLNGTPGSQGGTTIGSSGDTLTPFVTVASSSSNPGRIGERWVANFGGSAFRFPIPIGFGAYGTNTKVTAASQQRLETTRSATVFGSSLHPSNGFINAQFREEVTIGNRKVPLPEGIWTGLAFFRAAPGTTKGDSAVLGRFEGSKLTQMIAVNAYAHPGATQSGFPSFPACDRQDYAFVDRRSNEAYGEQRCWWINHAVNLWQQQSIFKAAHPVIATRGASAPNVLLNVGIHSADKSGFVTVFHYFDPAEEGIASAPTSWRDSEWFRDRIATDPRRVEYVKKLRDWGKSWAPIVFSYR